MTPTRRELLGAVSGTAVAALAACPGRSGSGAGVGTDTEAPAETSTPSPEVTGTAQTATVGTGASSEGQQAYPSYEWSELADATTVATDTVAMADFAFDPLIATSPREPR
ncbi:hypothetical protein BRC79_02325 [Halobacteriales archaeon QH_8_67_27]|nr:MAG: hypothetical protein BRC79_02325 [Halobacteriales archaeon QH_8_67_27]